LNQNEGNKNHGKINVPEISVPDRLSLPANITSLGSLSKDIFKMCRDKLSNGFLFLPKDVQILVELICTVRSVTGNDLQGDRFIFDSHRFLGSLTEDIIRESTGGYLEAGDVRDRFYSAFNNLRRSEDEKEYYPTVFHKISALAKSSKSSIQSPSMEWGTNRV